MAYTPHTPNDVRQMLEEIGATSIDELFSEIPAQLRARPFDTKVVPEAMTEMEATRFFVAKAEQDRGGMCFIGAGAYEHFIPAVVWDITSRGEFLTAYTPYQAEASQGTLQLLYEYQTMMASLMGLEVSNASLYDGASALAEAVLMAVRSHKKLETSTVLLPKSLHPHYREVVAAIVEQQCITLQELPYEMADGRIDVQALQAYDGQGITALVIAQPNFFGCLEDVDALTRWAHARGIIVIACVNPIAMALLKEPGRWGDKGADIVCGEGQPLGVPMASGGPYFGFLCTNKTMVRQMPGRLVGRTVDQDGESGFTLTLQAREQHIRRAKATSNICTNQGLLVTAATIYMSLMGPHGLRAIAANCHGNTVKLLAGLAKRGYAPRFKGHFFHEVVIGLPVATDKVLHAMAKRGIQGGFALDSYYPQLGNSLLICVTETKNDDDIERYCDELHAAISNCKR